MNERDKRRLGEQIEPGGRPKAPGRLELLQRFINSYNHDLPREWDRIGTARRAEAWLREKRLVGPGDRISDVDAARLRELREAMRALAIVNQTGQSPAPAIDVIRRVAAGARAHRRHRRHGAYRPRTRSSWRRWCRGDAPRHPPRGAAHRPLVTSEGLSPVRVRLLRPLEEPIRDLVRHVDLRQSDEEPRVLPAPPHRSDMSEAEPGAHRSDMSGAAARSRSALRARVRLAPRRTQPVLAAAGLCFAAILPLFLERRAAARWTSWSSQRPT